MTGSCGWDPGDGDRSGGRGPGARPGASAAVVAWRGYRSPSASCGRLHEPAKPDLEAKQGPDEQPVVLLRRGMLVDHAGHECRIDILTVPARRTGEQPADVVETLAPVPRLVRSTEALLPALDDLLRNEPAHRLPKDRLAFG